jgi:hypothetical protein
MIKKEVSQNEEKYIYLPPIFLKPIKFQIVNPNRFSIN